MNIPLQGWTLSSRICIVINHRFVDVSVTFSRFKFSNPNKAQSPPFDQTLLTLCPVLPLKAQSMKKPNPIKAYYMFEHCLNIRAQGKIYLAY